VTAVVSETVISHQSPVISEKPTKKHEIPSSFVLSSPAKLTAGKLRVLVMGF